jgi:hypothetical protein
MVRRLAFLAVAVLLAVTFSFAGEVEEAEGTVKAVSGSSITVTGGDGAEWVFVANEDTMVKAKGASHKMKDLDEAGEAKTIDKFMKVDQKVTVKYTKKDDKAYAKEIRVH